MVAPSYVAAIQGKEISNIEPQKLNAAGKKNDWDLKFGEIFRCVK